MIKLSGRTQDVINCLYVSEGERWHIAEVLETRCADKLPSCSQQTPESMERIRFAVLKLTAEKGMLDHWVEEAYKDWRDVLMAADFGGDVSAHLTWAESIMRSKR